MLRKSRLFILMTPALLGLLMAPLSARADDWLNKSTGGTVLGAGVGALIGNQFGKGTGKILMTIAGAGLGGYLGHSVGSQLDDADRGYADKTGQQALEKAKTGQAVAWRNPDNGHTGTITPDRTYTQKVAATSGGQAVDEPCRDFTESVVLDGKPQKIHGTACRQPNGTWQIVQGGQ